MSEVWRWSLALIAFVVACAASGERNEGSSSATGAGGTLSGPGSGGPGVGGFQPTGGSTGQSCQFVDLLFVIDNSPSMGPYQEDLAAAFPGFVDAMYSELPPNVDLHVGITTTSFFSGSCSEAVTNCVTTATPQEVLAHYTTPDMGDTGENGGQGRLFEHDGKRFFSTNTSTTDTQPLKTWFTGAAVAAGEVGCSFEMASAGAAYTAHAANATVNAGFLRDESAVLLVMVLSDEPDKSPEALTAYTGMLEAAKIGCGGASCILTAGIVDPCIEMVNNTLWQFLHAFGNPIIGDIDDPAAYTAVVGAALAEVVKQKCDEIGPPK